MQVIYQGLLFPPDESGVSGCALFGMPVHGIGDSPEAAVRSAAKVLQETIETIARDGNPVPNPVEPPADELARGTRVFIVATVPAVVA